MKHVQKKECVNVYQLMTVQIAEDVYNVKGVNKLIPMVIAITRHIVTRQWMKNVHNDVSMDMQVIANVCIGSLMNALNVHMAPNSLTIIHGKEPANARPSYRNVLHLMIAINHARRETILGLVEIADASVIRNVAKMENVRIVHVQNVWRVHLIRSLITVIIRVWTAHQELLLKMVNARILMNVPMGMSCVQCRQAASMFMEQSHVILSTVAHGKNVTMYARMMKATWTVSVNVLLMKDVLVVLVLLVQMA
jgi:hypothetical protein